MIKLRQMTMQDYDQVYALWNATPGMGLNSIDDSREGIAKYLRRNPTTCFAAEHDCAIIGAIIAGHDGRRGYIYHAAVLPEYQRQGIGRTMVDAVLQALEAEGISKVALVAFRRNTAGNGFWENIGFTCRDDLVYRNKSIREFRRIDT